jgi:ribosome biogenesis GTPase
VKPGKLQNTGGLLRGLVVRGSRNLFSLALDGNMAEPLIHCTLKGKILPGAEGFYNPLGPGDWVYLERDSRDLEQGLILALEERRNLFARFNQKGQAPQIIAANVDLALCVTSPASPPFRPRFLDRALIQGEAAEVETVILCNKGDLSSPEDVQDRLADYRRMGYPLLSVSVLRGEGLEELRELIRGKTAVMVGQSGVGKSSLLRALDPDAVVRVGAINEKYDRGNHTTTQGALYHLKVLDARLIDTPGIRRFGIQGVGVEDLVYRFRDMAPFAGECLFGPSCRHGSEKGCGILAALSRGAIHPDRYESYLRVREELV